MGTNTMPMTPSRSLSTVVAQALDRANAAQSSGLQNHSLIILVHVSHNANHGAKASPVCLSTVSAGQIAGLEPIPLAKDPSRLVLITVRWALTFAGPVSPVSLPRSTASAGMSC